MNSPARNIRLGPELDALLDQAMRTRGLTASQVIRTAVANELRGRTSPLPSATGQPVDATSVEQDRLTLRLPRFVLEAARVRGSQAGMSVSRWIASLVQSTVSRDPVFVKAELDAVVEASYQLAAVGRNINQIARALKIAHQETERIKIEKIEALGRIIKDTRAAIASLILASKRSWTFED